MATRPCVCVCVCVCVSVCVCRGGWGGGGVVCSEVNGHEFIIVRDTIPHPSRLLNDV